MECMAKPCSCDEVVATTNWASDVCQKGEPYGVQIMSTKSHIVPADIGIRKPMG